MSTESLINKTSGNWSYQVLLSFIVTALASLYYGYLMPGNPLPSYQVAIIVGLEALIFAGWGQVASDTF